MSNNKMEKSLSNTRINWYPGHMEKAKREIKQILSLIDIVYEVVDSRMPSSSKNKDIDGLIGDIPRIMIFSKYDLCDPKETDKFIEYYRSLGNIVIPVSMNNKKDIATIINKSREIKVKIDEERRKKGMKPRPIRVLVSGAPNVGKSTLINHLVGKKKAPTGDKPGITKSLGWIRVNNDIELLDTPGILWPKLESDIEGYNLAALSSIKEEIVNKADLAIYILKILARLYPDNLYERYGIREVDEDVVLTLDIIAKKRGNLTKGGKYDYNKTYETIIRDMKEGNFGRITLEKKEDLVC